MAQSPVAVAIVNTSPDIVRMLRGALERAGFVVVAVQVEQIKTGEIDVETFLRDHNPRVVVYDVAPPYDQNWRFFDHLRTATGFKGRHFVITSVNVKRVEEIVGPEESVYEIIGEPNDLDEIVRAVREAARARPTR